jgi:hypothetical protein
MFIIVNISLLIKIRKLFDPLRIVKTKIFFKNQFTQIMMVPKISENFF